MTIAPFFLSIARSLIPLLPKGKSRAIAASLSLFGRNFGGVITTKDGRRFFIDKISAVNRDLFFLNDFEAYETEVAMAMMGKGDYVFDVGSSFGWYTTLMSRQVGYSGKVFAFELVPDITKECQKNLLLNHSDNNVVLETVALGDKDGLIDYVYSEDLGLGNLQAGTLKKAGVLEQAHGNMTTLDSYIEKNNISKVDFIKCDIDGAEVPFLRGARKTFVSKKPAMLIEVSTNHQGAHGHAPREIFDELNMLGYSFFSLHDKRKLKPITADKFDSVFKENVLCLSKEKLPFLLKLQKLA